MLSLQIVMSSTETVDRLLQWTPTAIEANTSSRFGIIIIINMVCLL